MEWNGDPEDRNSYEKLPTLALKKSKVLSASVHEGRLKVYEKVQQKMCKPEKGGTNPSGRV